LLAIADPVVFGGILRLRIQAGTDQAAHARNHGNTREHGELEQCAQHNILGNRIDIEGYVDVRPFYNVLSDQFKADVQDLEDGYWTAEQTQI